MGDGIQKKYAIIINGDTEPRHLKNVRRAIEALRAEDRHYEIAVVSPPLPAKETLPAEPNLQGTAERLHTLIQGLTPKIDDDDLLVVYVTGHGGEGADSKGTVVLQDGQLPLERLSELIKGLRYGKRAVVMDQCFGGKGLLFFANEKTTVVTQGSSSETVCCQNFAPPFWSKEVPDLDGDGTITIQERLAYAVNKGGSTSLPQYFEPHVPISLSGRSDSKPAFPAQVVTVSNRAALEAKLSQMQLGDRAVIMFGADWCKPCKEALPQLHEVAKRYGGHVLVINAAGVNGSESDWASYGVKGYPAFAVGSRMPIGGSTSLRMILSHDLTDIDARFTEAAFNSFEDQLRYRLQQFEHGPFIARVNVMEWLAGLGPKARQAIPTLLKFSAATGENFDLHIAGRLTLIHIGAGVPQIWDDILKALGSADRGLQAAALTYVNEFLDGMIYYKQSRDKGEEPYAFQEEAEAQQKAVEELAALFFRTLIQICHRWEGMNAYSYDKVSETLFYLAQCFPQKREAMVLESLNLLSDREYNPILWLPDFFEKFLKPGDFKNPAAQTAFLRALDQSPTVSQMKLNTVFSKGALFHETMPFLIERSKELKSNARFVLALWVAHAEERGELRDTDLPALLPLLHDPSSQVVNSTFSLLKNHYKKVPSISDFEAAYKYDRQKIKDNLQSPDDQTRATAILQSYRIISMSYGLSDEKLVELIQSFETGGTVSRKVGALVLLQLKTHPFADQSKIRRALEKHLNDPDEVVQSTAASVINETRRPTELSVGPKMAAMTEAALGVHTTLQLPLKNGNRAPALRAQVSWERGLDSGRMLTTGLIGITIPFAVTPSVRPFMGFPALGGGYRFGGGKDGEAVMRIDPLSLGAQVHLGKGYFLEAEAKMRLDSPISNDQRLGVEIPIGIGFQM